MSIVITGSTGFVGQNLKAYLEQQYTNIQTLNLRDKALIKLSKQAKTVIHLAGKAHDLKSLSDEEEYQKVNTHLTEILYNEFCKSTADTFIYMSSVKAVADNPLFIVDENINANPLTPYGKSKLAAEEYLRTNKKENTRLYILRPCMIHGPNNKGNLNLLYNLVKKGIPYPLGKYANKRSFLSIDNLCFIISELIQNKSIPSGIYNLADNESFSTKNVIAIIGDSLKKKPIILSPPIKLLNLIARIGDKIGLPLNSERLQKLTSNYIVSNKKIMKAIGKELPLKAKEGLMKTFNSFD